MSATATPAVRRASSRIAGRGGAVAASAAAAAKPAAHAANDASSKKRSQTKPTTTTTTTTDGETATKKAKTSTGTLSVGDALPAIVLKDEHGANVHVDTLKKSVIFTYPKANTGGCTTQACLYRDQYDEWKKAGFDVYGLSNDGPTSLKNWKEKKQFQYTLLSDPKRELIAALTGSSSSTPRSHFVVDAHGKLALRSTSVKPAASSPDALKFAQSL